MTRACLAIFFALALAACGSEIDTQGGGAGGAAPLALSCPAVEGTWEMVLVPRPDGSAFCIDSRETTNDQYASFLASGSTPQLHPACAEATDFTPKAGWPPGPERGEFPVAAVTWCDAQAFCLANGKRLCAGVDGEIRTFGQEELVDEEDESAPSEMWLACTQGGKQTFVYGDTFEPDRCHELSPIVQPLEASASTQCEGGYPGIFFLQGNIWEWQAACRFETLVDGYYSFCFAVGGAGCNAFSSTGFNGSGAMDWNPYIGLRCCADALSGG